MSQYLSHKNFKWIDFKVTTVEYPTVLHDHDLLFCAEIKKNENMKYRKLITNSNENNNYVIYYRNLQQCIQQLI